MKRVVYKDRNGYYRRTIIKDTDDDSKAKYGIPAGPPDLSQLDWEEIKVEINNALVRTEVFDWEDVQRSRFGVDGALSVLKKYLVALYREDYEKRKHQEADNG